MTDDDATARFERCFTDNYPAIAAYLLRRCPTREDAEDAATEVFAIAWRRAGAVPAPPQDRLWLFGVARRVLANHARAARRRERLWHRLRERGAPLQATAAPDSDAARALRALPAADRELLTLLAWDGLTVAEIAQLLGVSAPVVSRRLYRARGRFAAALGDPPPHGHEPADMTTTLTPEHTR